MEKHIYKMTLKTGNKLEMFYSSRKRAIDAAITFLSNRGAENITVEKGTSFDFIGSSNYHFATVEIEIVH